MDKKVVGISVVLVFGIVSICLFNAFINVESEPEDKLSAIRNISKSEVKAGGNFTVTVTITALQYVEAPALDEDLPDGWTVTPISSDGGYFKASTTEWIWTISMNEGETKQIVYRVDVPSGAEPGIYNINGHVSAYGISPIEVEGDNQIKIPPLVNISIPHLTAPPNGSIEIPIYMSIDVENGLGSLDISITYNSSVIQITNFQKSENSFDVVTTNINNDEGRINIVGYQTTENGTGPGNIALGKMYAFTLGKLGSNSSFTHYR